MPPVAVPVPTCVAPSKMLTVAPEVAVPVKRGVVTFVMSSVLDDPESSAVSRSGVDTTSARGIVVVPVALVEALVQETTVPVTGAL